MLELHRLRSDKDEVIKGLLKRGWESSDIDIIDNTIRTDDARKALQTKLDSMRAELKVQSSEIGKLFQSGQKDKAESAREKVQNLKGEIKIGEEEQKEIDAKLETLLLQIPNVPHDLVPKGTSDRDNEVFRAWESPLPELNDSALPHWELASKFNIIDFELGAKITGSGFPVYRGKGAKLERSLFNFFLDEADKAGYEEILPPLMVNEESARATGQLPDKDGQMYHVGIENYYLIPTAEVPVTNIVRGQKLVEKQLPIKMCAYTPCFRREAGSYGADVKGLNRLHQFDKVEIVQIAHPEKSYESLESMLKHVESLLIKLELPYRILRLCGGDLGFTSAITYDFEVYSAAQKRWLEVSSVSNFETFQSNRMSLKFKDLNNKKRLTHTLNGSALALARIVAALLENNQDADGINIPEALQKYTGFPKIS
jgi:seryl-tRNA synthetase